MTHALHEDDWWPLIDLCRYDVGQTTLTSVSHRHKRPGESAPVSAFLSAGAEIT